MFTAAPLESIAQLALHGLWNRSNILSGRAATDSIVMRLPGVLATHERKRSGGGDRCDRSSIVATSNLLGGSRRFLFLANQTTFEPASSLHDLRHILDKYHNKSKHTTL